MGIDEVCRDVIMPVPAKHGGFMACNVVYNIPGETLTCIRACNFFYNICSRAFIYFYKML